MISKNELKYYSSLLKKKFRESEKKFIVEGKKSVYEGIESNFSCEIVFVTAKFASEEDQFIKKLERRNYKIAILKFLDFKKFQILKLHKVLQQYLNQKKSNRICFHLKIRF